MHLERDCRDILVHLDSRPGTSRTYKVRGHKEDFPHFHTEVHYRRVLAGEGNSPHKQPRLRLGIRSFISDTTGYISTAIGEKLNRPRPTETLPALKYRGTLRTRVGEGGHPPHTINSIYALVFGGTLQTRLCTFETRPGTPRPRLAESLTGRGRKKRFPPFHTGVHRRRVLVGWVRLPHHEFHLRLQIRRYISNRTWCISNATGFTFCVGSLRVGEYVGRR